MNPAWFEVRHPDTGETLEVEASYFPGSRGARGPHGEPLEPDESPEVVIEAVYRDGVPLSPLSREVQTDLALQILNEIACHRYV